MVLKASMLNLSIFQAPTTARVLCCLMLCCTVLLQVQLSNGLPARVTAIDDGEITLDLNHELAGKHLTFDVTLQSLVPSEALQKATFGAGCFWG